MMSPSLWKSKSLNKRVKNESHRYCDRSGFRIRGRLSSKTHSGPVEYFMFIGHRCFRTATDISEGECSKKHALSFTEGFVQSCPERSRRKGRSHFDARSVLSVRERERRKAPSLRARRSGKMATMSVRAASAKPENAACGFFQHSHSRRLPCWYVCAIGNHAPSTCSRVG